MPKKEKKDFDLAISYLEFNENKTVKPKNTKRWLSEIPSEKLEDYIKCNDDKSADGKSLDEACLMLIMWAMKEKGIEGVHEDLIHLSFLKRHLGILLVLEYFRRENIIDFDCPDAKHFFINNVVLKSSEEEKIIDQKGN